MTGIAKFISSLAPSIGTLLGTAGSTLSQYLLYQGMNKRLTGREREQNAFNAQQAQMNRDWEEQMSNTANQRAVADMEAAGLNPALMYGNGSAASTPTGSNAQGSTSNVMADVGNIVQAMATMKSVNADVALKRSQERLNDAKADESKVNAAQIVEMTENIKQTRNEIVARVEGLNLDNKQKEVIVKYADEMESAKLSNLKMDYATKEAQVAKFNQEIANLSEEQKKIVQETINLQEQVRLMMSQETLNYAQAEQCAHMCNQIDENVSLLEKENSHYNWNHIKTLSFKDGVAVVPDDKGEYAGSFTGPSATIHSNRKNRK